MNILRKEISKLEDMANSTGRTDLHQVIQQLRAIPEQSPLENTLGVYKDIRAAAILPECTTFFLISHLFEEKVDYLAEEQADELGQKYFKCTCELTGLIQKTIREYTSRHPLPSECVREVLEDFLEDEIKMENSAPSVDDIRHQTYNRLFPEQLRLHGEAAMARLLEEDPIQFERIREQGREFFHGRDSHPWSLKYMRERGIIDY